jgi:hypothetical protein
MLRRWSSIRKGAAETVGVITIGTVAATPLFASWVKRPSPGLLQTMGQIGATLLIAYVLEISWLVKASRERPLEERENRLGAFVGVGFAGLLGIAFSLALAERTSLDHWIWLDALGFSWVALSLCLLGCMVVMQPLVTHEWMDDEDAEAESGARSPSDGEQTELP